MGNDELFDWIPTSEAARVTGYSGDHLRRLCNEGTVEARKIGKGGAGGHGGMWLINRESLIKHQRRTRPGRTAELGEGGGE